jgi:putative tricarboxylic transport membrane protein
VKVLKVPYFVLFPLILLFCVIGVYSLNNNFHEVIIMIIFGVLGYLMRKFDYEAAPMIMAMILTPLMENNLRQSLLFSHGSFTVFFTRPISLVLIVLALCFLILPYLPLKKWKNAIGQFREKIEE